MADTHLIVSNPPHSAPDPAAIAPCLDCSAAEARIRLNFPAPEIWVVKSDEDAAGRATKELIDAGARAAWIPGSVLASVPRPSVGSAISIAPQKVEIATGTGDLVISSGDRVVAVLGEPVQQDARPSSETGSPLTQKVPGLGSVKSRQSGAGIASGVGSAVGYKTAVSVNDGAGEPRDSTETRSGDLKFAEPTELFLDIYSLGKTGWMSARLAPSLTDFSGLGERKQPMARANIGVIVEVLKADYGARLDERLMKVSYKTSIVSGIAINQLLSSISEQLATLTLLDIGSQLAFLTAKE